MSKKTTLFAITMIAAMPLAFAQAKPLKAEEITTQETTGKTRAQVIEEKKLEAATRKAGLEVKKTERQELMAQKKTALEQKRCEVAQKRIFTKTGQLENNSSMYRKVYGNMDSRLTRLVTRLDGVGLDTAKLKTDLATLKTMTQKLQTDYEVFITTFKGTETAACEKTKEEFKAQFEGARAQVALIKDDRAAIKDFFNMTIKPELEALKAQLPLEVTETETENGKTKVKNKVKQNGGTEAETETETKVETEVEKN